MRHPYDSLLGEPPVGVTAAEFAEWVAEWTRIIADAIEVESWSYLVGETR